MRSSVKAPNELTEDVVAKLLEENDAFAAAALEFQRQGKVAESCEFLKRMHRNIVMLLDGYKRHVAKEEGLERTD